MNICGIVSRVINIEPCGAGCRQSWRIDDHAGQGEGRIVSGVIEERDFIV